MKKLQIQCYIACAFFFLTTAMYAQVQEKYISPNNDGVQDELTIPLSIRDKRYIAEWKLVITDETGAVVRTIGNKVSLPEKNTFTSFFKQLFTPKTGVEIPPSVTWDGTLDSGEIASDGTYFYYFTAKDDNGNESKTSSYTVVVDTTPPSITLRDKNNTGNKLFGEGDKSLFTVEQTGSVEDLWTASFVNASGVPVRTYTWENSAPDTVDWDGKDDMGIPVEDGVYFYRITSTDRAGNRAPVSTITNIIYSAEKPSTNIAINGSRYFSPNEDGVQDTVMFAVTIPEGSGSSVTGNKLTNWRIEITSSEGAVVRIFEGGESAPKVLSFDGKNNDGVLLSDGEYQAVVYATYLNGYETPIIRSPVFILDNTKPSVLVRTTESIFSPDGDGRLDTITVIQETSQEQEWIGEILDKGGHVVRSVKFTGYPASSFVWEGMDQNGNLCEDGMYTYRLSATDLAGNTGTAVTAPFELNTGTTEVILTVQPLAFSPNGDGIKDTVSLSPVVKTKSGIVSYKLQIMDATGDIVKTYQAEESLPDKFTWNGLRDNGSRCPDGEYMAILDTVSKNGSQGKTVTQHFILDVTYPTVEMEVPYILFSPDGDGNKDVLPFTVKTSKEDLWIGEIRSASNKVIKQMQWQGSVPDFSWDGTDAAGNIVADGMYSFTLSSEDVAGNKASATITDIQIDTRSTKIYVTMTESGISPNGDGFKDTQKFSIGISVAEGIESWKFDIEDDKGGVVKSWSQKDTPQIPKEITWNGIGDDGSVAEGTLRGTLEVVYSKGNKNQAETGWFVSSVTPPVLQVKTAPTYFSPDNDGVDDDLFIALQAQSPVAFKEWSFNIYDPQNGNTFWTRNGTTSITERMVWDGRGNNGELVQSATDYPFIFSVTDELGLKSEVAGIISVDVLVIKIGDVLKIQVPSIIFRSDNADFKGKDEVDNGLEQSVIDNNIRVIKRIAEILNKFPDYTVRIEGHANNISNTEAEETSTANGNIPLVPLSEARAEAVKEMLVEFGVAGNRLSTVGMGGRQPVVPWEDKDNWWKNRRVEFILNKN